MILDLNCLSEVGREIDKNLSSPLADFGRQRGGGVWVNPLKNGNS